MDNFEYSIQLSDHDWAEFFSVAEECHLKQPSLATADDQTLSDLEPEDNLQEEGCAETCRQLRVSLCDEDLSRTLDPLDHCTMCISCHGVLVQPQALCHEDVLSGSDEEEGELGSVSRFLCEQAAPWPQATHKSSIVLKHLRSRKPVAVSQEDAAYAQKYREETLPHNRGNVLTTSLPKASSDFQSALMPATGVTPERGPELDQAIAHGLAARTLTHPSDVTDIPAEWSRVITPNTGILTRGLGAYAAASEPVLCHAQGVRLPGAHHDRGTPEEDLGEGLIQPHQDQTQTSEDCSQACMDGSLESLYDGATPGGTETEETKSQDNGDDNIVCNHNNFAVSGEQDPPPVLESILSEKAAAFTSCSEVNVFGGNDFGQTNSLQLLGQGETAGMWLNEEVSGRILNSKGGKGVEIPSDVDNSQPENGTLSEYLTSSDTIGTNSKENISEKHRSPLEMEEVGFTCHNQVRDHGLPAVETPSPDPFTSTSDNFNMTFPEAYEFFFCETCVEALSNDRRGQDNSPSKGGMTEREGSKGWVGTPEIYEYFFCEDQENVGADRAPLLQKRSSRTRPPDPIVTDGSPLQPPNNISFPEAYEYFFNDEAEATTGQRSIFLGILSSFRATRVPRFCRSLLPRRRGHVQARSEAAKSKREIKTKCQKLLIPVQLSPIFTDKRCQEQAEQKAVAVRGQHPMRLIIGQGDLCLVFLAFATWAVKTSDLQAPDAWKTALLANLGAITAIRYLRRRAGGYHVGITDFAEAEKEIRGGGK